MVAGFLEGVAGEGEGEGKGGDVDGALLGAEGAVTRAFESTTSLTFESLPREQEQ